MSGIFISRWIPNFAYKLVQVAGTSCHNLFFFEKKILSTFTVVFTPKCLCVQHLSQQTDTKLCIHIFQVVKRSSIFIPHQDFEKVLFVGMSALEYLRVTNLALDSYQNFYIGLFSCQVLLPLINSSIYFTCAPLEGVFWHAASVWVCDFLRST